jgi:hypothetical protein
MPHEDMQLIALTCPVDEQMLADMTRPQTSRGPSVNREVRQMSHTGLFGSDH